ncbi:hypothetical protein CDD82_7685 [Ophiocordyceps australis]|uniref:Uncharacterized protein n=1 Tax=Ophiocordyceps australis TaxID=1399860 RepID=A0A2C5Y1V3_9HYPO|nr:hypothetical protein CDD82_7685 [Ophiocordyceps australis]
MAPAQASALGLPYAAYSVVHGIKRSMAPKGQQTRRTWLLNSEAGRPVGGAPVAPRPAANRRWCKSSSPWDIARLLPDTTVVDMALAMELAMEAGLEVWPSRSRQTLQSRGCAVQSCAVLCRAVRPLWSSRDASRQSCSLCLACFAGGLAQEMDQ